jgi:hypothetical protein
MASAVYVAGEVLKVATFPGIACAGVQGEVGVVQEMKSSAKLPV